MLLAAPQQVVKRICPSAISNKATSLQPSSSPLERHNHLLEIDFPTVKKRKTLASWQLKDTQGRTAGVSTEERKREHPLLRDTISSGETPSRLCERKHLTLLLARKNLRLLKEAIHKMGKRGLVSTRRSLQSSKFHNLHEHTDIP